MIFLKMEVMIWGLKGSCNDIFSEFFEKMGINES